MNKQSHKLINYVLQNLHSMLNWSIKSLQIMKIT